MTNERFMNREELLRLAALDAFGLLDEFEAELYNRSFHNAPAVVQDEIVGLQAELVSDERLLPDEQPDPLLRERVLEAVARAMEDDAARHAPIASFGRGTRSRAESDVVAVLGGNRPLHFWRAASFVLSASLIVSLYFLAQVLWQANEALKVVIEDRAQDTVRELIGPDFEEFISNPNCEQIVLRYTGAGPVSNGTVHINRKTGDVFVMTFGLVESADYSIRVVYADGAKDTLDRLTPNNPVLAARRLDELAATTLAAVTWEVVDRATGLAVLTSA